MGNSHKTSQSKENAHSVKLPRQFLTKDEFFDTWYIWKKDFLTFKNSLHAVKYDEKQWGNMLLNIMGPVGHDIYKTFKFGSPNEKDNIDILLKKFDEYFVFLGVTKLHKESIYGYIDNLQMIVKTKSIANGENLIKNKILTEIDKDQFNNFINRFIPSFKFSDDFNKLTLKEIGFIWTSYISAKNCIRCGNSHGLKKCPSLGKQCSKCNDWNHFAKRCPKAFIDDCNYCGGAHMAKQCAAFNESCTKCKRLNHFSWKCQFHQIARCYFCGLSHAASRAFCSAKDTRCAKCKRKGHFTTMCSTKAKSYSKN